MTNLIFIKVGSVEVNFLSYRYRTDKRAIFGMGSIKRHAPLAFLRINMRHQDPLSRAPRRFTVGGYKHDQCNSSYNMIISLEVQEHVVYIGI